MLAGFVSPFATHLRFAQVGLCVGLVEVPAAMPEATHSIHPQPTDVISELWPEPVSPHPQDLVAQVDTALEQ